MSKTSAFSTVVTMGYIKDASLSFGKPECENCKGADFKFSPNMVIKVCYLPDVAYNKDYGKKDLISLRTCRDLFDN